MTDILCNWLNNDVKLSVKIDATNFAHEFATGYLIGEVLDKYQLQNDFSQFSQSRSAESKLNNFTRLEPVLHLLEVSFDTNVARDIMTEKHSIATRLMYQVYVAVSKKERSQLTSVAMETMRPAAPVKLEAVESSMYKKRLKHLVPRQTDTNLDDLVENFHQKQLEMEKTAFKERFEEEEAHSRFLQDQRQKLIDKYHDNHSRKSEMLAKIRAATVHIPKPPPNKTIEGIRRRREMVKKQEAEDMARDIDSFEERMKKTLPPSKPIGGEENVDVTNEYVMKIRKRLNEDVYARAEREKRRRKVLVDQLQAHEEQEEARREEMLVKRLMRQSQQERRIAVQLLQTRHEKQTIRNNRLMREQQYSERRLKEFEEAMNKEAQMAQLAKAEYLEQTAADRELHQQIANERAQAKYQKHYDMCYDMANQIVDYSTKFAEYRELTDNLVPEKLKRDWTALFTSGQPLYEATESDADKRPVTAERVLEEERQALLDEGDFNEYRNMIGEWKPPGDSSISGPPRNNPIIGHVVQRLFNIVHPPTPPPPAPKFPAFPIKACVLGKAFSGKTTCIKALVETHRLELLSASTLIQEAIEAYNNKETVEVIVERTPPPPSPPPSKSQSGDNVVLEGGSVISGAAATSAGGTDNKAGSDNKTASEGKAVSEPGGGGGGEDGKSQATGREVGGGEENQEEKGDAEKPVVDEDVEEQPPPSPEIRIEASPRAVLGEQANKHLEQGDAIDDQLLVDILVEAIKRIPEGTGWVMDNFPATYSQAKLLEKALSGFDMNKKEQVSRSGGKTKKSVLAADPKPPQPPPDPASGIDIVILFDVEDEICLKRSAGRYYAAQSEEHYHEEFAPPPAGSATGVNDQEQVTPVIDPAHDQEQIQHRLTSFKDTWPKLEKWFTRFGTLQKVDSAQEQQPLQLEVEHILETTLRKLQGLEPELPSFTEPTETEEKPPEEPKPEELKPPVEETPKPDTASQPGSKKGSRAGSAKKSSRPSSKDGKRDKSKSPARPGSKTDSGKKSAKGSRGSSAKSPKRGRSAGKGRKGTPEPEPETEVEPPPSTPPPAPGSEQWQYVDQEIDLEICEILADYWTTLENTYIHNGKEVFRNIRDERELIIKYFYEMRNQFKGFLKRPDTKQEFVTQWHKEYNELEDDLRGDTEARAELHARVDDLRESLWQISDRRKEQAEAEREGVIGDGWLDDHIGLLCNHYVTLMQAELDRYQDCVRIMKDYYKAPAPGASNGQELAENSADYDRLPLVELPAFERPPSAAHSSAADSQGTGAGGPSHGDPSPRGSDRSEVKSSASHRSGTPGGKKKKSGTSSQQDLADPSGSQIGAEQQIQRIPLIPRRPASPDPNVAAKGKADKAKKASKPGDPSVDSPPPPQDADDKLLYTAHATAVAAVEKILGAEEAIRDAEAEAELEKEREKEKEKEKAAAAAKGKGKGGKDKKGKSRSPSPKKGGKGGAKGESPAHTPVPDEEESEEEKQKKLMKERAKMEYYTAIDEEASAAKLRLDLIRATGISAMQTLRGKADELYETMNDWLGKRFLKEMESIDHLITTLRQSIESGDKIKEELIIIQDDFLLDEDVKTLKTPSPPPRPTPFEVSLADAFTVDQVNILYKQFMQVAPLGLISVRGFQEIFSDLTILCQGTETVPDMWLNITNDKLDLMTQLSSQNGEYVDWRAFLLAAANPWPRPTQTDLLDTLQQMKQYDQQATGWVTREQYDKVELWFGSQTTPITPDAPGEPYAFDRLAHLKQILFDIFSDQSEQPAKLNYTSMLMYMSATEDHIEGFLRALSVATGTHMPRLPGKLGGPSAQSPRPHSQISLAASVEIDGGEEGAGRGAGGAGEGSQQLTTEQVSVSVTAADQALPPPTNGMEQPTEAAAEQPDPTQPPTVAHSVTPPLDIPESSVNAMVALDDLMTVLLHGQNLRGDTHRFSVATDPEDPYSKERIAGVYHDLGSELEQPVLLSHLIEHPVIQDILANFYTFRTIDLKLLVTNPPTDGMVDLNSVRTTE